MKREEALDVALGQIERQFGKGSVMRMSDRPQVSSARSRPARSPSTWRSGSAGSRAAASSRSSARRPRARRRWSTTSMAEAQRRGGICAFIDAEHAMDPQYARRIGVDIDQLLVSQPDTGEQALEITELLIRSGALDIVAVDSVAALVPKAEIEGEMGDSHVGLQARLMSQALRKLAGTLNRTDTICIFTNQLREKIGVMFGNPETTPGRSRAQVLRVRPARHPPDRDAQGRRRGVRQPGEGEGGQEQGRAAVQAGRVRHHLRLGDPLGGHRLDVGLEKKVVQKAGSYFSFGDERLGQGRQNATSFLARKPRPRPADPGAHPGARLPTSR